MDAKKVTKVILDPKVEARGFSETLALGFSKVGVELTSMKIKAIGNGTFSSGAKKLAIGGGFALLNKYVKSPILKKVSKFVSGGAIIDGAEDIALSAVKESKKMNAPKSSDSW